MAEVARTINRAMRLNEDLAEPLPEQFSGIRLSGIRVKGSRSRKFFHRIFSHNIQSLRVVDIGAAWQRTESDL
ncbi:MAG: hypothetical protein R2860_08085 [Desulfobacterales bacterium]